MFKRLPLANARRVWRDRYLTYGTDAANVLYHVVNERHVDAAR